MEDKDFVDPELLSKIQRKQAERQQCFDNLRKQFKLTPALEKILLLSPAELLADLQKRKISASDTLKAYTAKALEVTANFNCITEFVAQAKEWATNLDSLLANESYIPGPLHGLPFAVKDDFSIEGMDTTLGFAKNLYKPAEESAALIQILMKQGAVPFAKTNIPQSLFSSGSENPIFGTTLNCLNIELGPGGSSSGSACLVAAGGATFATGSDVGGSLRIPSHYHGVSTLKPTSHRLSDRGLVQCIPKLVGINGVPGVISKDLKTLTLVWKAITVDNIQNEFDPLAVPVPWNERVFLSKSKLKIGYFTSLPYFPAFEDTQQAVLAAKDALESRGHSLIPFTMPDDYHYLKFIYNCFMADKGVNLKEAFHGEPISSCVEYVVKGMRNPDMVEPQTLETTSNEPSRLLPGFGKHVNSANDLWEIVHEKRVICRDILDRMKRQEVDLLLSPAMQFPAVLQQDAYQLTAGAYMMIWNFVDFPAGVVRFSTETGRNVESYDDQNDPMLKHAKRAVSKSAGMPINVQVIGRPFQEELVLRTMMELEEARNTSLSLLK